jgi:hypothetical protein
MASSPAQAIEAFNRLSDQEKTKVLGYICAAYALKPVQETEGIELPRWTMLAMFWLLFIIVGSWVWRAIALYSTQ